MAQEYVGIVSYRQEGCGAFWYTHSGAFYDSYNGFARTQKFTKSTRDVIENMRVGVKMDLNERSVYYGIDGGEYKKAPHILEEKQSYRLAVSLLMSDIDEMQFL